MKYVSLSALVLVIVMTSTRSYCQDTTTTARESGAVLPARQIFISPARVNAFSGNIKSAGQEYTYSLKPLGEENDRFQVSVKSLIKRRDFGNLKEVYETGAFIEDAGRQQGLYRIKIFYAVRHSYRWNTDPNSFYETIFDLQKGEVSYRVVGKMREKIKNTPANYRFASDVTQLSTADALRIAVESFVQHSEL